MLKHHLNQLGAGCLAKHIAVVSQLDTENRDSNEGHVIT